LEKWNKKDADLNLFEYSVVLNLVSEAQTRTRGSTHFPQLQESLHQVNHHLLKVTVWYNLLVHCAFRHECNISQSGVLQQLTLHYVLLMVTSQINK